MFQYNKFWHFWSTIDNRYYARPFEIALGLTLSLVFFATGWLFTVAAVSTIGAFFLTAIMISGGMLAFTKVSDFFYHRQQVKLQQLHDETEESELKEQVSFYLNRRAVCPERLLAGEVINLSKPEVRAQKTQAPLRLEEDTGLILIKKAGENNRNLAFTETAQRLFVKEAAAMDALSEVSAREMVELMGFPGLIPNNAVADKALASESIALNSSHFFASHHDVRRMISVQKTDRKDGYVFKEDSEKVQARVEKFLFQLKAAAYRTRLDPEARRPLSKSKLTYIQALIPRVKNGTALLDDLLCEPVVMPGRPPHAIPVEDVRGRQRKRMIAKGLLNSIDQTSYEENTLSQMILGSQDCNAGNTLFSTDARTGKTVLYSVDHERIMPEDNYNMTKSIPFGNTMDTAKETLINNIFPMKIWLFGLPQANAPFSRETMQHVLDSWDPARFVAYHRQKKLFPPTAVGAQLERVQLIRQAFEAECKKSEITLTPKALFNMFVNNHPTYGFLKDKLKLHDVFVYQWLGQISEDADWDLLKHPLQYYPMKRMIEESVQNEDRHQPNFSEESLRSPYAPRALFYQQAIGLPFQEKSNPEAIRVLDEASTVLKNQAR
jgi:hypothetical protein